LIGAYNEGVSISDLFRVQSMGITSARDNFVVDFDQNPLEKRIQDFCNKEIETSSFQTQYKLKENYQWKVEEQRAEVTEFSKYFIKPISYRPFDNRWIYYQANLVFRMRGEVMQNLERPNLAFCTSKLGRNVDYHNYFITKHLTDKSISSSLDNANMFPLYIYQINNRQQTIEERIERTPNLNQEIVNEIAKKLDLTFTNEKDTSTGSASKNTFAPIDILDYIYAVLHSPTYREKYKEFLKIDFPRVPYPRDKGTFWKLVKLGGEIRQIHLLESPKVEDYITTYPKGGDNTITTKIGKKDWELFDKEKQLGRIWINEEQYFNNIPLTAWEFYIGGYQPAQKWLKDRKERTLAFDDILHYQKIIVALSETDRLMKEIDKIEIKW